MPDERPFYKYAAHRGVAPYDEMQGERSFRDIFHHDRAEVTYSKFFRRMAFRQYHITADGPDNRTRLLHSIEVATIASGMARRLGVNPDLTEAIALGHDIAQPPCGYPAEKTIKEWLSPDDEFDHGVLGAQVLRWHSLKRCDDKRFERLDAIPCFKRCRRDDGGYVTSISEEALDGIARHTPPAWRPYVRLPRTIEGQIVRMADNLSYISQEIEEGICLDAFFGKTLKAYMGETVLKIDSPGGESRTKLELIADQPGCTDGKRFLEAVFDTRLGPRLVAMFQRIESYNTALLQSFAFEKKKTRMKSSWCQEGHVPILRYDPILEFLLSFLWTNFIGNKINKHRDVKKRAEQNHEMIRLALDKRVTYDPSTEWELAEFKDRLSEVKHWYPQLDSTAQRRRAVAHHIALLTTDEIHRIVNKGYESP
jgi:putative nucleotidyltransferase with HDIG domain